jgi:threonine/homoserine/homoserine lactone efflux protein
MLQVGVSLTVNALIVIAAGSMAGFLTTRPCWSQWQRRATGTLLGGVALSLAREVPTRARI